MNKPFSNSKIDALGERLRDGKITIDDIKALDAYRRSFGDPYREVVRVIRDESGHEPTGRPAKSTNSIIEKLRRESVRLSQIQDIAGARIIVPHVSEQDQTVAFLNDRFPRSRVFDRRKAPSHGYRAVHVVVRVDEFPIEVQVRSPLQHLWAEISEKLSDVVDSAIKYGSGNKLAVDLLSTASELVYRTEIVERGTLDIEASFREIAENADASARDKNEAEAIKEKLVKRESSLHNLRTETVKILTQIGGLGPIIKERNQ